MGRGASLHTMLAALLLLLHVVELPAAVPQALLVACELKDALVQTPVGCASAGLKAAGGLLYTDRLCCTWCLQLQAVSWRACNIV